MADGRIKDLNREISDFSNGDFIIVDGTIGTSKMAKDSLLNVTAQNALDGNVAPVFDHTRTSDNPYKAGESVAYEGKTYTFKVDHYGAWSAADVTEANIAQITTAKKIKLDTPSLWRLGGIGRNGFYNSSEANALCSVPIFFQKNSIITIKRRTGVTFSVRVIAYDKSGCYLGFSSSVSQKINFNSFLKEFPTAKSFALYIYEISGITADPTTIASTILIEDDSLFGVSFADEEMFESFKETQKTYDTTLLDFNDKSLWHRGALNTNTGLPHDVFYNTRMYSDMVELYAPYSLTYTLKTGVTASVGIFVYDKDDTFLGWRSDSYAYSGWMLNNYTGACKYRIMIYNITGATTSVENLDNILSFSLTSYPSNRWMDVARTDAKVNYAVLENVFKKKPITLLKRATKLPCFAFTFDDVPAADDKVAALFESKGLRCGWAFIANDSNFGSRGNVYLELQNKGHEVLNHSVDGKIYNTTNYATFQAAYTAMQTAYETMKDFGFVVNGFVAPSSSMYAGYKPIIGMLNAFGFVEASGETTKNDENTPVTNLHRYSIQSAHSLQDIKDWVDSAITNNELVVFYGHASDIVDEGDFTMQKIEAIIDYVLAKRDAGLCHVDIPTNIIREYYDL